MSVSVVVATYNGEKYIREQLDSLYNQTVLPDEVLIFDDCSTDSTVAIINKYIEERALRTWRLICNNQNCGWRTNFMTGLRMAAGQFVFPCDQDDVWLPKKIEIMTSAMEENPNISLLACGYSPFFDDVPQSIKEMEEDSAVVSNVELYTNIFNVKYPGCTYCVRKDLIEKVFPIWRKETAHDELLWRTALFEGSLYVCEQSLIFWRRHRDSAWTTEARKNKTMKKRIEWIEFAKRQIMDLRTQFPEKASPMAKSIIIKNESWLNIREQLFATGNVKHALALLGYIDCYNSLKQYFGDVYIAIFKRRR